MVYGSLQAFSFPRPFSLFRGSYRLEPRLVPSHLLFIPLRIGIWEGDQCAQTLLGKREKSDSVLSLMHRELIKSCPLSSADKRSDWIRVCLEPWNRLHYMAGCVSDKRNQILSFDWLPERAKPLGLACCVSILFDSSPSIKNAKTLGEYPTNLTSPRLGQ